MEIDKKLKNARIAAGLTQEQTAQKIKVSRQTLSNWETGKFLPDIISLIKLSDLYQMSLDDLLKGNDRIIKKIEKDTSIVKSNQIMMIFGWVTLFCSFSFSIWNTYNGNSEVIQFISAAAPWVMMGIGIACIVATISKKEFSQ